MSSISFEIDPKVVLGVGPDATLEQIREAYRRKSKSLHPDVGGEEWAFRVLAQSYELLCTARVRKAAHAEPDRPRTASPAAESHVQTGADRRANPSSETVRGGIHDTALPASRLVALEHLCVRYLWDDSAYLWLTRKKADDERFLSCSINLTWPDQGQSAADLPGEETAAILAGLGKIFDRMAGSPEVVSARVHVDEDDFSGWLTYANFEQSWSAVKAVHQSLQDHGLGLRQWSRDLFIPKNWR